METTFELTIFFRNPGMANGRRWRLTSQEANALELKEGAMIVKYHEKEKLRCEIFPLDLISRTELIELESINKS